MRRLVSTMMVTAMTSAVMSAANMPDVTGQIIDEMGEPMPFVNVVLLNAADSSFIHGTTSDEAGDFLIATAQNKGILKVSSVGYQVRYINVDAEDRMAMSGNVISMQPDQQLLDEVTVSGQLPKTKLTARGMETGVLGSVLERIGSAEDALSRVPGLMKTANGLQVIGKGTPVFYINGRKVQDMDELKRLRSNDILSVEVITNPGAQYDATVGAVVRIKTVRRQGDGFGFNAGITDEQSLRVASNNDPFGYLNMNWRCGNVDVFGGGSFLRWHNVQTSNMMQKTFGSPSFEQPGTLDYTMEQRQAEFNLGTNWQIADNHSVGIRVDRTITTRTRVRQTLEEDLLLDGKVQDHVLAKGHHDPDDDPNVTKVNTYYNGTAGKLGIDLNADYLVQHSSQICNTDEVSSSSGASTIGTSNHAKNELWAAKLVLSYPVWKGALQVGTEETFSRRNEDYSIFSTNAQASGSSSLIPSTVSKVSEDNVAAFVEYALALPKVGQLSAGLRYEHVNYCYDSDYAYGPTAQNGHENIERTYDNFFPSVAWANAYPMRDGSPLQLSVSYSMKTQRPDFYSLNSAIRYHSRYIWQSGNAALQNQTNHALSMNARWKIITLIAQYNYVKDAISQWSSLYNDEGIVLVKSCNLNDPVQSASYYINVSPTLGCWTMNYTVGVQQQWFETDAKDPRQASGVRRLNFDDQQFVAQLHNTWRFGARNDGSGAWQLELGGTLQTKGYSMNTKMTNNYFNLDAAIQKSLLKNDALTLRIEGTDLAKTADYNVSTDCGSHLITQTNSFDQHRIKFSATYSFNAARSKYKGTGAGKDAQQRMSK